MIPQGVTPHEPPGKSGHWFLILWGLGWLVCIGLFATAVWIA